MHTVRIPHWSSQPAYILFLLWGGTRKKTKNSDFYFYNHSGRLYAWIAFRRLRRSFVIHVSSVLRVRTVTYNYDRYYYY